MSDSVFVDTNILIYAHDIDAGKKHEQAAELLKKIWMERVGALSTQILQEFYVNVTRKIKSPISKPVVRELIRTYSTWQLIPIEIQHIIRATEIEERYQLSFWDGLIVAAASMANIKKILSEDLSHKSMLDGVQIENPFAD